MRKLIASEWISLDGVFDGDTMDQWFMPFDSDERQDYIRQSILTSDAMLFGRTTWEMLKGYWSGLKNDEMGIADKLNSMPKYVVSTTLKNADWNNSTIIKGDVVEEITKLKQQAGRQILISGSATLVKSLMKTDLIDEYQFLLQPIIVGTGKRFFRDGMPTTRLKLVKSRTFSHSVTLLTFGR